MKEIRVTAAGSMRFQPSQLVTVRSEGEIRATLDATGKLDGLPFMPEMSQYCGKTCRVARRADEVFLDHYYRTVRMTDTVFLEGIRCSGAAHRGCDMRCLVLWKEAWLQPAGATAEPAAAEPASCGGQVALPTTEGERLCCQATELRSAGAPLAWWQRGQYLGALLRREVTLRDLGRVALRATRTRIRAARQGRRPAAPQPPATSLNLQPGDAVEVKTWAEIEATLDAQGKNRGLLFTPEMADYCGRRFRVSHRVQRMIVEWTGELRQLGDTVALEGVTCRGLAARCCPRSCHHLWREAWLKRVGN